VFNPFGANATLGDSPGHIAAPLENIHAPQGRVPVTASSLTLPPSSRSDSRPDFARGFGLDVPEVDEPEEFIADSLENSEDMFEVGDAGGYEQDDEQAEDQDRMTPVAHSRFHSRHVSNALSLGSVGGRGELAAAVDRLDILSVGAVVGNPEIDDMDQDAIGEWTGSEDIHLSDMSEDEVRRPFCLVNAMLILCRRALASGPILLMKKKYVKTAFSVEHFVVISLKSRSHDVYQISLVLRITL